MFQFTLCILKPDIVRFPHLFQVLIVVAWVGRPYVFLFVQEIIALILRHQFLFVKSQRLQLTRQRAGEFYQEHEGLFSLS